MAAALAGGGIGLVVDVGARQVGGQNLALGLLFDLVRLLDRAELRDLVIDGLQVLIQGVFQQAALLSAEALRLGGKLQALEDGVLMGDLSMVAFLRRISSALLVSVLNKDCTTSRNSSALMWGSFSWTITMKRSVSLHFKKGY